MMFVLIGIIVLRVVPAFSDFYGNFDRKLPASTEIVVAISNVAVTNIWLILAVVAGVVAGTLSCGSGIRLSAAPSIASC